VWVDDLTRWAEAVPVPDIKAGTITRAYFNKVIARWGAPLKLFTDRAQYFMGSVMGELAKLMRTTRLFTTLYHPEADMVERFNGTLIQALSRYMSYWQREWDAHLQHILFAYRSAHSATKLSLFEAMTGIKTLTRRGGAAAQVQMRDHRRAGQGVGSSQEDGEFQRRHQFKVAAPEGHRGADTAQLQAWRLGAGQRRSLAQVKRGKRSNKARTEGEARSPVVYVASDQGGWQPSCLGPQEAQIC
jgi:hypothetical protein